MRVATRVRRFSFVFPFFLFGVNETSVGSPFDLFSSDNTHSASGLDPRKSPPPNFLDVFSPLAKLFFSLFDHRKNLALCNVLRPDWPRSDIVPPKAGDLLFRTGIAPE